MYQVECRLPYVDPQDFNEEQQKLYDLNLKGLQGAPYIWMTEDKKLNGPSNSLLHEPEIGTMVFTLDRLLCGQKRTSKTIQELVILVAVSHAKAAYGIYAHSALAEQAGLSPAKIAAVTAGQRPADLTDKEAAAYDLAFSLCQPGPISGAVYDRAVKFFGNDGLSILVYLVGMFQMIGTILNAYNEPVPEYRKQK